MKCTLCRKKVKKTYRGIGNSQLCKPCKEQEELDDIQDHANCSKAEHTSATRFRFPLP
jgi:hypothetical protein